jgi:GNAT superfamily N-acetyltransferase
MVEIGLRTATVADTEFLYRCLRDALGPYVEQAFGPWDEEQQRSLFFESTDPASHDVVSVDGEAAGCTCIPVCADHIEVKRIFLLPEFQNRGIGARLMKDVIALARSRQLPIRLRVFEVNRAQRFYQRLGFSATGRTATHVAMEWRP